MAKRTIGLSCDPIEVEVCFAKETVRERIRETGSPALVPLAAVMNLIKEYQQDALRYRWLRDGPKHDNFASRGKHRLGVQDPERSALYAVVAAQGERLDKLVDEERLLHEFEYQAYEAQFEHGSAHTETVKFLSQLELRIMEELGVNVTPTDWKAQGYE